MPIIHLTADDALHSQGAQPWALHIEEDADCDGVVCGGRPELVLTPEQRRRDAIPERPPIGSHWHIVAVLRNHPDARRYKTHVEALSDFQF
jgi:hypothetical protein